MEPSPPRQGAGGVAAGEAPPGCDWADTTDDHFDRVLAPVLRELSPNLSGLVVIGGWVPELHRRFGQPGDWAVQPLHTTELDVLASMPGETDPAAPLISAALALRHGLSPAEGRARAKGYLTDFAELIPEDCG